MSIREEAARQPHGPQASHRTRVAHERACKAIGVVVPDEATAGVAANRQVGALIVELAHNRELVGRWRAGVKELLARVRVVILPGTCSHRQQRRWRVSAEGTAAAHTHTTTHTRTRTDARICTRTHARTHA